MLPLSVSQIFPECQCQVLRPGEPRELSSESPLPSPPEAPHLVTHRPHSGTQRNSSTGVNAGPPSQPLAELSAERRSAARRQRQLVPATPGGWQPRASSHRVFTPCTPPASWPHTSASHALGTEHSREGIREESSGEQVAGRKQEQQKTRLICPHPPLQKYLLWESHRPPNPRLNLF